MKDEQRELWDKIEAFAIDDPGASLPFSARLARENGWTLRHAHRVIAEYKRFVFLMATSATPVCPSEGVDEAWHLHLCYTRSYWEGLCRGVVGRPIHHEPTQGGGEQLAHHQAMYERTLAAYRAAFNREPPADIWPAVHERFAPHAMERVDRVRNWVLPKPQLRSWLPKWVRSRSTAGALGGVAFLPLLGDAWIFDLDGPAFLVFFVAMMGVAAVLAAVLRRANRVPDDGSPAPGLSVYQLAVLANGDAMAGRVALTKLVRDGLVEVRDKKMSSVAPAQSPAGSSLDETFEYGIHRIVEKNPRSKISDLRELMTQAGAKLAADLQDQGLLETPETFRPARRVVTKLFAVVLLIGVIKLVVGIYRIKPVGILMVLLFVCLALTGLFWVRPPRTLRGDRVLNGIRDKQLSLKKAAKLWEATPQLQMMGIALFGIGALSTQEGALKELYKWIGPPGGGGCSGGGCGGSGCGGDGGGCGGCGGD